MTHPVEILDKARALIAERGIDYGGIEQSFERAAMIASLKLNREISAYDVATVLESVKDARNAVNPTHADSHLDAINYRAFRAILCKGSKNG